MMSEQTAKNDVQGMKETLSFAMRLVFFVTLPAMVGLIVLRLPIINLLFQRGAFNAHSAEMTAQSFLLYALGLASVSDFLIIFPSVYSLQDTKTPVKVAFLALLANAGFGAVLMIPLKHAGLALATSLAAGLNFVLLVILLKKKLGRIGAQKIFHSFLKSLVASVVMGAVAYLICAGGPWHTSGATLEKIVLLLGAVLIGMVGYGGVSYFLGSEEMYSVMEIIRKKIKSKP